MTGWIIEIAISECRGIPNIGVAVVPRLNAERWVMKCVCCSKGILVMPSVIALRKTIGLNTWIIQNLRVPRVIKSGGIGVEIRVESISRRIIESIGCIAIQILRILIVLILVMVMN